MLVVVLYSKTEGAAGDKMNGHQESESHSVHSSTDCEFQPVLLDLIDGLSSCAILNTSNTRKYKGTNLSAKFSRYDNEAPANDRNVN